VTVLYLKTMLGGVKPVPDEFKDCYLVLWDSQCDFCRRSVGWLQKKAPGKVLALPYQEQISWLPEEIFEDCQNQFYLRTPPGNFLAGGDALIILLRVVGWKSLSWILGLPVLRQLTRLAYKTVARNRDFFSRFLFKSS